MKFPSNWQIYSTSFMTGVFPKVLTNAKVVPVFKKDSKSDYSNYQILKKYLKNLYIKDCIPSSITIITNS